MKVKMIGTGAMYTKYNSACTLINEDLIVDMPNGTVKQLLKMNLKPENIDTILITHMHGDHTADIPFFLKYIYNYLKVTKKIKLIGPKGIKEQIVKLFKAYRFENEREINEFFNVEYIEFENFNEVKINDEYEIKAILVEHGEEKPAFGYVINNKLGLTGDSSLCKGIEKVVNDSKIIISDTSFENGENSHLGIDNLQYLMNKYKKSIIATHLRDTTRNKFKNKIDNIKIVEDGYEFEI